MAKGPAVITDLGYLPVVWDAGWGKKVYNNDANKEDLVQVGF
ncbi:hypothetical protein [Desulfotruncus arcticus]|nr:hypothetical protein [Desulfotruncus arcticus]